jgi:hypothetical protein
VGSGLEDKSPNLKKSLGYERISTIVFLKLSKGLVLEQTREKEIQRFEVGLVGFLFCLVSALAVVDPHISLPIYIYIYIYIRYDIYTRKGTQEGVLGSRWGSEVVNLSCIYSSSSS